MTNEKNERSRKAVIRKIVTDKIEERETRGYVTLQSSDISDIIEECERYGVRITRTDLHKLGLEDY